MQEMDRRVALLRLLLADITDRERQADQACTQLRTQLARLVDFTVQYNGSVANALSAMEEVEERLAQQEMTLRHLALLRQRARSEMEALIVTRGVADARARLAELETRRATLVAETTETTETTEAAAPVGGVDAAAPAGVAPQPTAASELAAIDAEIAELRAAIQSASEAVARALTEAHGEGPHASSPPRQRER